MFHMEHCVFAAFLSAGKDARDCGRPCERHAVDLRDRVGASFPVLPGQVGPLLDRYTRVFAGLDDGRDVWRQLRAMNQLGVTRGTLQLV